MTDTATTTTTYEVVRRTAKSRGGKGTTVATHTSAMAAYRDAEARDRDRSHTEPFHQVRMVTR